MLEITGATRTASPAVGLIAHVGSKVCTACHAQEASAWRGSHHDLAMQEAAEGTVLGDFSDVTFTHFGVTSRFFRSDGRYFVHTDGPHGTMADFKIKYTFGIHPLQQYLIEFPDGRLQALSIAWDSRPNSVGGQSWFHLYPNEPIRYDDELHWTKPSQNWNFMCAECHSTNVRKNYDATGDRFRTTFSEINVACEACHGPGARHVEWAERQKRLWRWGPEAPQKGLAVVFDERRDVTWTIDAATGNARRSQVQPLRKELETCGRCHARRAQLSENWVPGRSLSDTHLVSLLDRGLYHPDGQMLDEVYNYGSFRQSKMFVSGVTCADCHEPHSQKLRAPANGVCLQCHTPDKYESPRHHHHESASPPLGCPACHMPTQTYMVVDPRHDHSFRVPRPDLSIATGAPNACNDCHKDKQPDWAAGAIERWHGPNRKGFQRFGEAFHAARLEQIEARDMLRAIVSDPAAPAIARATAYSELGAYLGADLLPELRRGLADSDPLVRIAALRAIEPVPVDRRWPLVSHLLDDPVRAVRIAAASFLAAVPADRLSPDDARRFERAVGEYIDAQRLNADRPEARTNLGAFFAQRGQLSDAESEYRAAIRLRREFVQAYINLADVYRMQGREKDGEAILRDALAIAPGNAAVHHALGLLLVRERRRDEAIAMLAKATELDPQRARYAYVHAVALNSAGARDEALRILETNHERHPADRDTLVALVTFHRERGNRGAALRFAERLARLTPSEPALQRLIDQLRSTPAP